MNDTHVKFVIEVYADAPHVPNVGAVLDRLAQAAAGVLRAADVESALGVLAAAFTVTVDDDGDEDGTIIGVKSAGV